MPRLPACLPCDGPQDAASCTVSFDGAIVVFIVLSCAAMSFESCTLEEGSALAMALEQINLVATAVFTCELVLKVRSPPISPGPPPPCMHRAALSAVAQPGRPPIIALPPPPSLSPPPSERAPRVATRSGALIRADYR